MTPTFLDGDVVRVDAGRYLKTPVAAGDVVLAAHPYKRDVRIVKRVDHVTEDGRVFLLGDNPSESTDSRMFGALRTERILGPVARAATS